MKVEEYEITSDADELTEDYRARLEALRREKFPPEGREERIAKARAAFDQPPLIKLTPEEWREVMEEAEVED